MVFAVALGEEGSALATAAAAAEDAAKAMAAAAGTPGADLAAEPAAESTADAFHPPLGQAPYSVVDVDSASFLFFKSALDWRSAEGSCVANGGHLASLITAAENEAVVKQCTTLTATDNVPGCWIGLNDEDEEGQYRWTDGSPYGWTYGFKDWYQSSGSIGDFSSQPDDDKQADDEDCAFIYKNFVGWHDRDCNARYYYVCKVIRSL